VIPLFLRNVRYVEFDVHQVYITALRQISFSGFCHVFDRAVLDASHHVVGIAFANSDGEPYPLFEKIWPILLREFSVCSTIKILQEASEFRSLGYVREKMLPSGTVLFDGGNPTVSLTGDSYFGISCHKHYCPYGGLDNFFRDPREPWFFDFDDSSDLQRDPNAEPDPNDAPF
jgi:hypothetical protein